MPVDVYQELAKQLKRGISSGLSIGHGISLSGKVVADAAGNIKVYATKAPSQHHKPNITNNEFHIGAILASIPQLKTTAAGNLVCDFTVSYNPRNHYNSHNHNHPHTHYNIHNSYKTSTLIIDCYAWKDTAKKISRLPVGSAVMLSGRLLSKDAMRADGEAVGDKGSDKGGDKESDKRSSQGSDEGGNEGSNKISNKGNHAATGNIKGNELRMSVSYVW